MRNILLIVGALVFFSNALFSIETKKELSTTIVEDNKEKLFIEIIEVPKQASETKMLLDEIEKNFQSNSQIVEIHESLPSYSDSIKLLLDKTMQINLETVGIEGLRKKSNELNVYIRDLKKWSGLLTTNIKNYNKNLVSLSQYRTLWKQTAINARNNDAPDAIIDQISMTIDSIDALTKVSKKEYDKYLTDANTINKDILALSNSKDRLKNADMELSSNLFYKNSPSLFSLFGNESFETLDYFASAWVTLKDELNEFILYYASSGDRLMVFFILSFFIVVFVFRLYYLYKKHRLFIYESSYQDKKYFFILRPFSTALLLVMLLNVFMFMDISETAKSFQRLFLLIPVFRIFQVLLPSSSYRYLYFYLSLYILSIIERNAFSETLDGRVFSILLTFGLGIYLYKLVTQKRLSVILKPSLFNLINIFIKISIAMLFVSFIADIYGWTLLALYISKTIFVALYALIVFYILTGILTGYTIILLRRRIATATHMVEKYATDIEKSIITFVKLFMTLWWFIIVLTTVKLYDPLFLFVQSIFTHSWLIGEINISAKSVIHFLFIIFMTWFIAKLIRMVLEVEVFARFKLPRGVPTAIHTVLNYIIVIIGTIFALSSLGISKDQFTLVAGALGVGIGFGLRNIIANFVSGLIMVFERPIQVGDTIEINNTMGTVQDIGARSSTVATFDGSEVIIPNADFISRDITNWTLSDERRRKTLVFKVAVDSDIYDVLAIMKDVVISHPNTLDDPEPIASFLGFNEHYLEFKLYFWLNENLIMAQSDIAIGIYQRLKTEGIKMPVPQQKNV